MASRLSLQVAEKAAVIVPSDTAHFDRTRHLQVGTSGDLHVLCADGTDMTLPAAVVTDGWQMSLGVTKVFASGTTAGNIVGYW